MPKPTEVFGKNLQAVLGQRKQTWLAKQAGTTAAMISDYIAGKTFPNLKTLERIADALDRPLVELLGSEIPKPRHVINSMENQRLEAIGIILKLDEEKLGIALDTLRALPGLRLGVDDLDSAGGQLKRKT